VTDLDAGSLATGSVPTARLSPEVSLLGPAVDAGELSANSVSASALAADAIQAGDIEAADLPSHAALHRPGGADPLPTASAVDVGASNGPGTSGSLARADHVHAGLRSLAATGQPQLTGNALLAAGRNVSLIQSGQTITIEASGGGAGGNRASVSASNAVAIASTSDTELLTVSFTPSQAASAVLVLATVQLHHASGGNDRSVDVKLLRGTTALDAGYTARIGTANQAVRSVPVSLHAWDTPGAGAHVFRLLARGSSAGAQATIRRLTIIELP
jgi:hypothetical protein